MVLACAVRARVRSAAPATSRRRRSRRSRAGTRMSTSIRRRTAPARSAVSSRRLRASRRASVAARSKPKGNVRRATGTSPPDREARHRRDDHLAHPLLEIERSSGRGAHPHRARRPRRPVAVSLCGPCRNGQRGTGRLTAATLAALAAGRAYVNVHTPKNPGGEIRGQIRAVPLRSTDRRIGRRRTAAGARPVLTRGRRNRSMRPRQAFSGTGAGAGAGLRRRTTAARAPDHEQHRPCQRSRR